MRWLLVLLVISALLLVSCQTNRPVFLSVDQVPGNHTWVIENECGEAVCGSQIVISETP